MGSRKYRFQELHRYCGSISAAVAAAVHKLCIVSDQDTVAIGMTYFSCDWASYRALRVRERAAPISFAAASHRLSFARDLSARKIYTNRRFRADLCFHLTRKIWRDILRYFYLSQVASEKYRTYRELILL